MRSSLLTSAPRLGVGISCEFGGGPRGQGLDALALRAAAPGLVHFLEVGADLRRGLDDAMLRWAAAGLPTTYHFLDVNLAEREDLDGPWVRDTVAQARRVGAVWLCGDAGYWHIAARERGHDILLPPILCPDAADEMADCIGSLQEQAGMLVLPENPPATAYVGPMHLLDFYARVVDRAGCGFLLDCAHLAIFQRQRGLPATAGLDGFPLDRIVELHLAGGRERQHEGYAWIEDTHEPEALPETWAILEAVLARGSNVKAIVYECEHNPPAEVLETFERLNALFPAGG